MPVVLFLAQRASAQVLAPLVLVHLGLAIYAIHGGLSAAEILARTQGSLGWTLFYGLFVVAASVHAPIGLRNVLREWLGWKGMSVDLALAAFGLLLLGLGFRAVGALTGV
ncbi:MAG: succinate dehydrogenase [Alphaproteobacteria bacterium]|nr:succinate dehydrogenase [Alphaproteobacteria bacterium]